MVKPEVFNALPEAMRKDVETKIEALQKELASILERLPKADKQRREQLSELNEEVAKLAVDEALDDLLASFADVPAGARLRAHGRPRPDPQRRPVPQHRRGGERPRQAPARHAPTTPASAATWSTSWSPTAMGLPPARRWSRRSIPRYGNLIGRVEHIAQMGTLVTDFLLIKPGALHRANGGYLLVDARKRAALAVRLGGPEARRQGAARSASSSPPRRRASADLHPDARSGAHPPRREGGAVRRPRALLPAGRPRPGLPAPLQGAGGFRRHHRPLARERPAYARLIASIVQGARPEAPRRHRRGPRHRRGRAARRRPREAVDRARPHLRHRARGRLLVGPGQAQDDHREDVARAIEEQIQRADRLRDRAQETIARGIVLVDTEGAEVGQINGLSVLQLGSFAFGRPSRITAPRARGLGPRHRHRARGQARRPAALQGRDDPVGLPGRALCARRAAGARRDAWSSSSPTAASTATAPPRPSSTRCCRRCRSVPIRQSLAVTGSVNQRGEVQAIGGVNEKIEGFFDICRGAGPHRRAGRADPEVERAAPDAAARTWWRPSATGSSRSIAVGTDRRGHRDPDRRQGRRARRRGPLPGRDRQPPGGGQAEDRSPSARAASPRARRRRRRETRGKRNDRARRRDGRETGAGWCCSWDRRTRAPSRCEAAVRIARAFQIGDREPVRGGRAAVRLRRLRLRARGVADGAAQPRRVGAPA